MYENCDLEYAEQVTAEEKVIEKSGRKDIEVWRPKTAHADNHYLDCEVYAAFAADCLGIRYRRYEEVEQPKAVGENVQSKPKASSWAGGDKWI